LQYEDAQTFANGEAEDFEAYRDFKDTQPLWDDVDFGLGQQQGFEDLHGSQLAPKPADVDERIVLLTTQERFLKGVYQHIPAARSGDVLGLGVGAERPENHCTKDDPSHLRWAVGRATYYQRETPVLHSLYYRTKDVQYLTRDRGYYKVDLGKTYELVLQNYPACNGACETHPYHLHGHHFWVVGTWPGEFNGTLPHEGSGGTAYRRDTIQLIGEGDMHRPGERRGCGFTVLRFKVTNPGAWAFHCHAEWHYVMGMSLVFYTDPDTIPPPPRHISICGLVKPASVNPSPPPGSPVETPPTPSPFPLWTLIFIPLGLAVVALGYFGYTRRAGAGEDDIELKAQEAGRSFG